MNVEILLENDNLLETNILDEELNLGTRTGADLLAQLFRMYEIRTVEKKIAEMRQAGFIGGPVHLAAGQEAIAVGISKFLKKTDRIFSAHRSHAHLLALGSDPYRLFAEILGKSTGLSKGMGGSMHLWDKPNGFYGSVPIVAGTVPLAVGAGLAAKMQNLDDIGVAYFGDGAAEEGIVHESLNLASQLKLPVLFICENNLFSSHMHISQRQPKKSIARFAKANDIAYEVVDGNNIISVENASKSLISKARNGAGPAFIEAITYRHFGHVDWRDDIDVGVNRSSEDLAVWRSRDPITRLELAILASGFASRAELDLRYSEFNYKIQEDWKRASADPYPLARQLLDTVYSRKKT